jgi:arginase family enzyme
MYNQIKIKRDHGTNRNNETNGKISSSFRFVSTPHEKVTIIGVLMDLGADRRGVDMGPSAVRDADLTTSGLLSWGMTLRTRAISWCPIRRRCRSRIAS